MAKRDPESTPQADSHVQLTTTHWSLIVAAGGPTSTEASDALNQLCQIYWHPVYALIRRSGQESHAAKDLTQDFIIHLIETHLVHKADRNVGKFRSFLRKSLDNFLEDNRRKSKAIKRGGRVEKISIDEAQAEARYEKLPLQEPDPTKIFDRAWAATVIEKAMADLKETAARRGRLALYEALAPFLAGESNPEQYAQLADGLQMTRENLQSALSRLRREFGGCLREVIAGTVNDPTEVDDEIRHLLAAWAARTESDQRHA